MAAGIRRALAGRKTVETTPSRMAFMVWDPPGHKDSPWLPLCMPGMLLQWVRHVPRADRQRLTDWETRWARRRHELLPEPHWYAEMLAVDPQQQGYGLGAVLVRHGLARADVTGTPTFLEAHSARNATMCAKLGFVLTEHGHDDVLDIPVWRMIHRTSRSDPQAPHRTTQSRKRRLDTEARDVE